MSAHAPVSSGKVKVTAIAGDGIGPEVMAATRRVLEAAGARIAWEDAEAGAAAFRKGIATGCPQETLDSIARTGLALKGPLQTPVGYGEKSANVTLRKHFELYGNIRPVREIPGILTPFSGRGIDLVIVRENVEDLYAGIEYMQTPGVAETLKLISEPGCERILHLAFALARAEARGKVACATKANIMKMTEGLMKRAFERIAPDYAEIAASHIIIDNCAHQLVIAPEQFEVIVTTNMNGDIISDLAAGLVGGLGVAASANIGDHAAMFEAVHGSAPQIAGRNLANPTAFLLSAVMLLRHVGDFVAAGAIEQAVYVTLAEGRNLTGDIAPKGHGVGTDAFTNQVIANLGRTSQLPSRSYSALALPHWPGGTWHRAPESRSTVGVDVFVETAEDTETIARGLQEAASGTKFTLSTLANRGAQVWPETGGNVFLADHFRARFMLGAAMENASAAIADLLGRIAGRYLWMHVETLQRFDGADAFTKAQGES